MTPTPPTSSTTRWAPVSPCAVGCLPATAAATPAGRLAATARLGAVGAVLGAGAVLAAVAPLLGRRGVGEVQRRWAVALLAAAGVRVDHRGGRVPAGALVVSNHVSWLDVLVLATVAPVRLLAKREVRAWPLIGVMAARVGTVFLDRERLRALPAAVDTLAGVLRSGGVVAVFAEGTTRCGRSRGRFRPAAFQAAVDADAPVVPVALSYVDGGGTAYGAAAFVGDDTLWASVRRIVEGPRPTVRVDVRPSCAPASLTPPTSPGRSARRRELAARCAAAVEEALVGAPAVPSAPPAPPAPPAPSATAPCPAPARGEMSRAA